ncbi:MAG: HXXEE domain-containing protein [Prevotellaceae bacterium]|nr:HXXEE domain-containing protein [Prevotellaceae bacterium]
MDSLPFWILTVAYAGHILEEYVLDWRKWVYETSGLTLEWTEFFIANFAVIILGIACSATGFECPVFSYMFVALAAINAIFAHLGTTVIKRKFSPGLITSVLLFIPVCTWAYIIAGEKEILTVTFILITSGGGLLIMLFPVILNFIKRKM